VQLVIIACMFLCMVSSAWRGVDRMPRRVWSVPDEGGGMPPSDFATPKE
jgi:hypothetical protein